MSPEPEIPSGPQAGNLPPRLTASQPPMVAAEIPSDAAVPPLLSVRPEAKPSPLRQLLAILLSLGLALFLADAVVSLLDDSLILFLNVRVLTVLRGIVFLLFMLTGVVIYGLMGVTPMIPKRLFLPVTLFTPLAGLLIFPFVIYFFGRTQQIGWVMSFCQVILGLGILYLAQGRFKINWPLVAEKQLGTRGFSWLNLSLFLLLNVFVLVPVVAVYLAVCVSLAVEHSSEGFLALRPRGLTVQVRTYARSDGKKIQLFPMAHVGDRDFYRKLSQSFPTNAIILMEGVTDQRNLLTNKISYQRMATSLGLSEQQKEFKPNRDQVVRADVDIEEFATNTIDFLNLVMLIHAKGLSAETVMMLAQYSPPPAFEERLFDDLLTKRNRRLLEEVETRLPETETIIVPWGAAHMPGIARGIQKSGFRLTETREYVVIRFGSVGHRSKSARKESDNQKPE
jgi:hypothetical protein